jgi:peptidoglycan/LPS O-acetylase OafA/YrhL
MGRNPAFDGLRALAVGLVILHHARVPWLDGGALGVDIFFVLSGYLITSLLMQEIHATGGIAVVRFLVRRALRLMPPFLVLLLATLLLGPVFWPNENLGLVVAIAGIYLADYASAFFGDLSVLAHTWSLSVEEHFYLVWPIAIAGLARWTPAARPQLLLAVFVAATLWRLGNAAVFPDIDLTYYRFDTRLSGLLIGAW